MPHKFMAASVPRYLRQTKLGHLPLNCIIGSRATAAGKGNSLYFDIIMLPVPQFQRMRSYVGLQHAIAPVPSPGGAMMTPVFVPADTKEVTVPADEPDPELWAKAYFIKLFKLDEQDVSG